MMLDSITFTRLSLLFLFLLYVFPYNNANCESAVPECCDWESNNNDLKLCNWTATNWTNCTSKSGNNTFACLEKGTQAGQLERTFCGTKSNTYCLKFRFRLRNRADYLNVSISWSDDDIKTEVLWSCSNTSGQWIDASVPLMPPSDFTVKISGMRQNDSPGNRAVRLDDLIFEQSNCSIQPVSTTNITCMATVINRSTKPRNSSVVNGTTGLIAGIIAVVIVIVVTVLAVLIIVRRKHISLWQMCCEKRKKHSGREGYDNRAMDTTDESTAGGKTYTGLNSTEVEPSYINGPGHSLSTVDEGSSSSYYSDIRDPESLNQPASDIQSSTSMYWEAQPLSMIAARHRQPSPKTSSSGAKAVGNDPNVASASVGGLKSKGPKRAIKGADYTNVRVEGKPRDGEDLKSEHTSVGNATSSPTPSDSLYQNVKGGLDGRVGNVNKANKQGKGKGGKGKVKGLKTGENVGQSRSEEYYNTQQASSHSSHPQTAAGVYHILEADPENDTQKTAMGGAYFILEPENSAKQESGGGMYHILEETGETRDGIQDQTESKNQNSSSQQGGRGGYNSLDFQKKFLCERDGDDPGKTYSRLNDADDATYDELQREKKRKVVAENYSHVKVK